MEKIKKLFNIKWTLVLYDAILYLASFILMFVINKSISNMQIIDVFINSCVGFLIVFLCRFFGRIYNQIWRYGGIQCYIRLLCTDMLGMFCIWDLSAAFAICLVSSALPFQKSSP